jgi:Plant mobile domain
MYLRAGGLIFRDEQPHDITPLRPRDLSAAALLVHLLGKEMIDGEASRWAGTDFCLPLRYHGHQLDWTRYILTRERDILCSSGVYNCIFLSMFRYHIDTPWLCAFCERWSYSTNTLFIDDRELTPTLWEIRQLTGLLVFGHYYDEFLLSEGDLRDPSLHPASFREVYKIYDQLRGQHLSVPFRFWISYFTDRLRSHPEYRASTRDPFGTGRLDLYSDVAAPSHDTLCSHVIDLETYLTAFLSWWICLFLLPSSGARTIRPSVFVMASQIARGERVSLAVPVLANIYRSLRGLTSSRDPSRCRELVPWHFISGWLHMHWSSVYHPSLSSDLRASLPILGDLAGIEPASLTPEDTRFRFYHSHDHLRLARARLATHHLVGTAYRSLIDAALSSRDSSPLRGQPDILDYFISLRHGFLPLRIGDYAFIEPYSPHRCAHQFGLDQDVPTFLLRPESLAADLEGLGWCYSHLFRLGTGSHFQTVPASCASTFSRRYI